MRKTAPANDDFYSVSERDAALASLDLAAPVMEPPKGLWSRIDAALAAEANSLHRFAGGRWRQLVPGIRYKHLWDKNVMLLECQPGAVIPDHKHRTEEHVVVLSGDLVSANDTYLPGDYHITPAGGTHPAWTTRTGCIVLVRHAA